MPRGIYERKKKPLALTGVTGAVGHIPRQRLTIDVDERLLPLSRGEQTELLDALARVAAIHTEHMRAMNRFSEFVVTVRDGDTKLNDLASFAAYDERRWKLAGAVDDLVFIITARGLGGKCDEDEDDD